MSPITPELLVDAMGCLPWRAADFARPIDEVRTVFDIDTPERMAAFLAQVGHETNAFRWLREIWGPTRAQTGYEGRTDLGNTHPGDGKRFMGRGLIQLTGRANYGFAREQLRLRLGDSVPDFEARPDMVMAPRWAALTAGNYWHRRGLNALADAGAFEQITRRINGGLNGQPDRLVRWERAKRALEV